jgi:hypothetical protein
MAKVKKEDTVKETVEAPMGEKVTVKETPKPKRMKNLGEQDETIKVNLKEPKQETVEKPTDEKPQEKQVDDKVIEEVQEKVEDKKEVDKKEETEKPVLEEVTVEKEDKKVVDKVEAIESVVEEAVDKSKKTGQNLPENIQKVVDFMNETGGDLNDYVKLNQDYSKMDDGSLLREYYQQTKPHLNNDEINFLMEDSFSYDEEIDEPLNIKRKKLAFKEQVANAKNHLDGLKSKYYEEIKSGVKLTSQQQKAIDFFNRYNTESKESQKVAELQKSTFLNKTDQVFNDKFKGFEYNVGEKNYRFNVTDVDKVKDTQSDINNFVSKFVNKNNIIDDANGYHKSLFTAMNADAIANHFYQQGKADAVKETMAKAKNVDMSPRETDTVTQKDGLKFKVLGDDSNRLRFKIKN